MGLLADLESARAWDAAANAAYKHLFWVDIAKTHAKKHSGLKPLVWTASKHRLRLHARPICRYPTAE